MLRGVAARENNSLPFKVTSLPTREAPAEEMSRRQEKGAGGSDGKCGGGNGGGGGLLKTGSQAGEPFDQEREARAPGQNDRTALRAGLDWLPNRVRSQGPACLCAALNSSPPRRQSIK